MTDPTSAGDGCSLGGNISRALEVGDDMAKRKSPFTVATSANRPKLRSAQFLQAAQEANLLAAELQQQAQVQLTAESGRTQGPAAAAAEAGAQLSKSSTMRLRGLTEILAGEE